MKQIRYENREFGISIWLPVYSQEVYNLDIHASPIPSKRSRVEISVDSSSPLELEITAIENCKRTLDSRLGKGYLFTPLGGFHATVHFSRQTLVYPSDLEEDEHVDDVLRNKAGSENAYNLYQYVHGIPLTDETLSERHSRGTMTPTQIITSNRARKCTCKAELLRDLYVAAGIPARVLRVEYYDEKYIEKHTNLRRPSRHPYHAFNAFYDQGWHLADAALGGFDLSFQAANYYQPVIWAKGCDEVYVNEEAFISR